MKVVFKVTQMQIQATSTSTPHTVFKPLASVHHILAMVGQRQKMGKGHRHG